MIGVTQIYSFDLVNHLHDGDTGSFYRINVEAESEAEALEKAKKEANLVASEWVEDNKSDHLGAPFRLYKQVGYVNGWIPEDEK